MCKRRLAPAAVLLALAVAGCGGGSLPDPTAVSRVKPGMSIAEVESILGSGRRISKEDYPKRANPIGDTFLKWSSGRQLFLAGFLNGKLVSTYAENLPEIKGPAGNDVEEQQRDADAGRTLGLLHYRIVTWGTPLKAQNLPATLDEFPGFKEAEPALYQRIKRGDIVVRWGAPLSSPLIAYFKDGPEKGGWVLRGRGNQEKLTAEQIRALLAGG